MAPARPDRAGTVSSPGTPVLAFRRWPRLLGNRVPGRCLHLSVFPPFGGVVTFRWRLAFLGTERTLPLGGEEQRGPDGPFSEGPPAPSTRRGFSLPPPPASSSPGRAQGRPSDRGSRPGCPGRGYGDRPGQDPPPEHRVEVVPKSAAGSHDPGREHDPGRRDQKRCRPQDPDPAEPGREGLVPERQHGRGQDCPGSVPAPGLGQQ